MTLDEVIGPDPDLPEVPIAPLCPICDEPCQLEYQGWRCESCHGGWEHATGNWVSEQTTRFWELR